MHDLLTLLLAKIKVFTLMISQNYDSGQVSEEATVIVTFCVIFGSLVDNLPLLQFISYLIGSLIGIGTLILNWDKYCEKVKEIYFRLFKK